MHLEAMVADAGHDGVLGSGEAVRTATPEPSHYGALCVRERTDTGRTEVLLITSRVSGRWVIPKGRPMKDRKPHQVARREAWEEAGVRGFVHKKPCGNFRYRKTVGMGELIPCLVQVHLLEVARLFATFPEMAERRSRWFEPAEAAAIVNEAELSAILLTLDRSPTRR